MPHQLEWFEALAVGVMFGVAAVFPLGAYGHAVLVAAIAGDAAAAMDPRLEPALFGWLRVAVAVALISYFWRDWLHVLRGLATAAVRRGPNSLEQRRAGITVLACVPGCAGAYLLPRWTGKIAAHPTVVAVILAISGLVLITTWLWWRRSPRAGGLSGAHRARMTRREEADAVSTELSYLPWRRALLVGLAPLAVAVPGASATGLALSLGLFRAMTHEQAARFGLVLVGPALLVFGLRDASGSLSGQRLLAVAAALVAAYLATALLVRYFRTATLRPFGVYCLLAGAASAWWLLR